AGTRRLAPLPRTAQFRRLAQRGGARGLCLEPGHRSGNARRAAEVRGQETTMDNEIPTGKNRTRMETSPVRARELLEVRGLTVPPNPERDAVAIRAEYLAEAEPAGSMPPPPTLKGMAGTAMKALTGKKMHVLLDKMGERAAYERTGT